MIDKAIAFLPGAASPKIEYFGTTKDYSIVVLADEYKGEKIIRAYRENGEVKVRSEAKTGPEASAR